VGWVPAAADSQGFQTGQAFVDLKNAEEGVQLFIFQGAGGGAPEKEFAAPTSLLLGDRATLATLAQVVSRFPK
jgi:glycine hydroxymethyltransferase